MEACQVQFLFCCFVCRLVLVRRVFLEQVQHPRRQLQHQHPIRGSNCNCNWSCHCHKHMHTPRPPPPLTGLNFWHVPALFFGSPAAGQQRFPCICIRSPAISFQIRPEQKYMALFGAMARKWAGHKLSCTIVNRFCLGALVFYFAF